MKKKYFNPLMQLFAFLVPIYFVFYGPLNDNRDDPFIKSLWRFIIAGSCFYIILAVVIFVLK